MTLLQDCTRSLLFRSTNTKFSVCIAPVLKN